jgi:hypothetical protein
MAPIESTDALETYKERIQENISDVDDQEFLDLLDESDAFEKYRASRIQQLANDMKQAKENIEGGHGSLITVSTEKELLDLTVKHDRCVVHFMHPEFQRCKVMNKALEQLSKSHTETLFVQINATDAPFLVTKLSIKVLPLVLGFVNAQEKCKLIGFEALGGTDSFPIGNLQTYLAKFGVINGGVRHYSIDKAGSILGFNEIAKKKSSIRDTYDDDEFDD